MDQQQSRRGGKEEEAIVSAAKVAVVAAQFAGADAASATGFSMPETFPI